VNPTGSFTYSVPAAWNAQSCEEFGLGTVVAPYPGDSVCGRGEYYQAWLLFVSAEGDQRANLPPNGSSYSYTAPITGTSDVTVDGVNGHRYTAYVTASLPLPPPKGTDQVMYVFFDSHRTFFVVYEHWPMEPDRTADFDKSVQQTLRFST
jgi:hypothetical protein